MKELKLLQKVVVALAIIIAFLFSMSVHYHAESKRLNRLYKEQLQEYTELSDIVDDLLDEEIKNWSNSQAHLEAIQRMQSTKAILHYMNVFNRNNQVTLQIDCEFVAGNKMQYMELKAESAALIQKNLHKTRLIASYRDVK